MKLYHSPTSPYVRKVRVVAIEKGLADRIELVDAVPWPDPAAVAAVNPLGKVPALLTDDGVALYDSPVICEYLDVLVPAAPLIPRSGAGRWQVLRCQALCDGILDAAVGIVLERRRPPAERSQASLDRAAEAIRRSVGALGPELRPAGTAFDLGQISIAVALGYLEFRLADLELGVTRPVIRDWWAATRERPSLVATRPP
ncbi:MAG TPA: glutathione S-transferase N-terminal domain-containing protein [Steroidobacteraceae bacterium]|nr:glutathione S-transferase N-terminal domain-containing protein [Steroidobacteraceae bacterium]